MANPDARVEIIKEYAMKNFKTHPVSSSPLVHTCTLPTHVYYFIFLIFTKVAPTTPEVFDLVRRLTYSLGRSNLQTQVLDFALGVEQITTKKRDTLILNVDGCIAVCFVDMLRSCGAFTLEEADELFQNGCLNGLFVLGQSLVFFYFS